MSLDLAVAIPYHGGPQGRGRLRDERLFIMADRRSARRRRVSGRAGRTCRLASEPLEDRRLLAVVAAMRDDSPYGSVDPAWFATLAQATPAPASTGGVGIAAIGGAAGVAVKSFASLGNIPGEWVVRLAPSTLSRVRSVADAAAYLATTGVEVVRGLGLPGQILVRGPAAAAGADVTARLRNVAGVSYVSANAALRMAATPDDPSYRQLYGLDNTGQTGGTPGADIDAARAWDVTTGSRATVVGVVDTGIDWTHPDLAPNVWTNPGEIAGNGIDDDANGFVDDVHGFDFVNRDGDPMDDHGHGSHVSGTIGAAGNNGVGVVGVNWDVSLMGLKFLDDTGSGSNAAAIEAINYATMMRSRYGVNVRVLNNSWGGGGFDPGLLDAINASGAAGILFVAAAGNAGADADRAPGYPAAYDAPNVVSVAATDHRDALAGFSNYGAASVDLAAPGVAILSTVPGGGYATFSGTSMATPHVAGAAALALSVDPGLGVAGLKSLLLATVDPLPSLAGKTVTGGRLNADRAVRAALLAAAPASVTGTVYEDVTGNAAFDAGDRGVRGVTVFIDSDGDGLRGAGEPATATTAAGEYAFRGLAPGSYRVRAVAPAGWAGATGRTATVVDGAVSAGNDIGIVRANAVYGRVVEDVDGNGTIEPGEQGIANQLVFDDVDGDGLRDVVSFVAASGVVAAPIRDFATATSAIVVTGPAQTIVDLNVSVAITHTWVGDLRLELVAPDGSVIPLSDRRGGAGRNFTGTVFDDEAATPIASGVAPFTGSFRPDGSLARVDGLDCVGTWTLRVADGAFGDVGTLDSWSLGFTTTVEQAVTTDATGRFVLAPLAAGPHTVRLLPSATFVPSGPAGGGRSATLADGGTAFGVGLTAARRGSIAGTVFADVNGDGVRDAGDAGLPSVTVYVDANGNGTLDATEARTTTDDRGVYRFTGRTAATHVIRAVVPAGLGLSGPATGRWTVALASGGVAVNDDFALTTNRVPTGVTLSAARLAENAAAGTVVGTLAGIDPDIGDPQTLGLVPGDGADDNASFAIVGGQLRATAAFDFETRRSASIRVRTTDALGQSFDKVLTVAITDVNESPTGILLSRASVPENAGVNAVVGTLAAVDPDAGDTFTFALVAGVGADDNAAFNVSGTSLRAARSFDFETRSSYSVRLRTTDRGGKFTEAAFVIGVTDVNDRPVVGGVAGGVGYVENGVVTTAPDATVTDVDSVDFSGGQLTVRVSANATATDRLEVWNEGVGVGQVGVVGGVVTWGGEAVGTMVGGTSGSVPLVVTFNAASSAAVVQGVLRAVRYRSTSDNPLPLTRTLSYTVSDGDGGTSTAVPQVITITPVNDAPVVGGVAAAVTYVENAVLLVAPAATITDVDSPTLSGGVLEVSIVANGMADDRLGIRHQGTTAGLVGVSGSTVTFGGAVVGSFTGGTFVAGSVTPLAVTFTAAATPAIAQAVLRNVFYTHGSEAPVAPLGRTIGIQFGDGVGGAAPGVFQSLAILPVNDAPVLGEIVTTGAVYSAGGPPLPLAAAAVVGDVDSASFAGGVLSVAIVAGGLVSDRLSIQGQGTAAGEIGVAGNTISYGGVAIGTWSGGSGTAALSIGLGAAATPEAVQALLRRIVYASVAADPTSGGAAPTRSIRYTLSDASAAAGGRTATVMQTLGVTAG